MLNLVARKILFGKDPDALQEEIQQAKEELKDLELWRKKGPIGKLHNIIKYIRWSGQREQLFEKIQEIEISSLPSDDPAKKIYKLVKDQETHWNSSYDMIKRAVMLRSAIHEFMRKIIKEYDDYIARITHNNSRSLPKRHQPRPTICDDYLTEDDWSVLTEYLAILKPFKIATKRLEGRAIDGEFSYFFFLVILLTMLYTGRYSALWEVLPTIESLLKDIKIFVDQYSPVINTSVLDYSKHWNPIKDWYLRNNLQLGWEKLDKYYRFTDDSSAYVAAIALHPRFKWRWIQRKWADRIDWQIAADQALRKQWELYKAKKIKDILDPDEAVSYKHLEGQRKQIPQLEYFMEEEFQTSSDEEELGLTDEYTEWQKIGREKHVDNPVAYWYDKRSVWPHLASFALDLFGVPAMSAEPERVFSSTGRMVQPDRGCLKADVIGAAACLKQWDRNEVIEWK
jgi:hypothetical protein